MKQRVLRERLVVLLRGEGAHASVEAAFAGLPPGLRTRRPPGFTHSAWELLEHVRIAQEDILRYTLETDWVSPPWPAGYWPKSNPRRLAAFAWERSLRTVHADLRRLIRLVRDPSTDLEAEIPHAEGVTYLGEVLLVADHNAYHAGQVVSLRQALGAWPPAA